MPVQRLIFAILLAALAQPAFAAEEQKLKVPPDALLAKSEALLKDIYKDEYAQSGPAQRRAFAKKLLEQGRDPKAEPAVHFVVLREARNVAASAGDITTALHAVEELNKAFIIDAATYNSAIVTIGFRSIDDMQQALLFLSAAVSTLDQLMRVGDFAAANKMIAPTQFVAVQTHNPILIEGVRKRLTQVKDAQLEFERLKGSLGRPSPAGDMANGKFACFFEHSWQTGLSKLATGGDAKIKEAATKDLADARDASAQLAIGDLWWDVAQKQGEFAKSRFLERARYWYLKPFPQLTGLAKARIEKRILTTFGAPSDASTFGGHAYAMVVLKVNWHEAKLHCELAGGHLACIESAEEEDFVESFAQNHAMWLGGTDEEKEGQWKWVTGNPFEYTAWHPGEPSNSDAGENYLELLPRGKWNDVPNRLHSGGFMCEWE